tara:strand:+ start:79 stop:468 length:390 start_codon:yes stop_codon:yes gene_type:complete
MPTPTNKVLYNKVKAEAKAKFKVYPSAYANGWLVKTYKSRGGKYSDKEDKKKPVSETTKKAPQGLTRWFKEKWETQSGSKTYKKKGDIFRPTKRITKDTPTTMSELSPAQKKKAMAEKKATGKVKKYKK